MANRGARMTKTQKQILINYLEEHTMMLSPKLSMAEIPQIKQHWETVANKTIAKLESDNTMVTELHELLVDLKNSLKVRKNQNYYG
jgi:hypothetical protein